MLPSFTPASARVFKASAQADYMPAGIRGFRSAAEGSAGTQASVCDAEGEPHGAAALIQLRDLMPVNVVGVNLGQRPGDAVSTAWS